MKQLTIIITALNEGIEPLETIKSIHETADKELFDIILFNDGSKEWIDIPKEYNIKVVQYPTRQGAPANYDKGVEIAQTRYVAIFNARMRFKKGWLTDVMKVLVTSNSTIFCTTSVQLDKDGKWTKNKMYGAKISKKGILEPQWLKAKKPKVYDIPCVLGANYFVTKKWYQNIRGFQGLYDYGGMCAYISLKSWVMGGKCQIIKGVEIGNIYREFKDKVAKKPYLDNMINFWYNKVFTAFVLMPVKEAVKIMDLLFENEYYTVIQRAVINNIDEIIKMRSIIKSKTVNNVNNYLE